MKRKLVVQTHHIRYGTDEWIVRVFKGEHMLLTFLNRRKNVSLGFVMALQEWLRVNVAEAVAL